MLVKFSRFLLAAAVACVLATVNAGGATKFKVKVDVVDVVAENSLEVVEPNVNSKTRSLYTSFAKETRDEMSAGTLTWADHNQRFDEFLANADKLSPGFYDKSLKLIQESSKGFTDFFDDAHGASWDVMYYGASKANDKLENKAIAKDLEELDAYMVKATATASTKTLQKKFDTFYTNAEAESPGFKGQFFEQIKKLYASVTATTSDNTPSETTTAAPASTNSTSTDETSKPTSETNETTTKPAEKQTTTSPAPSVTTSDASLGATLTGVVGVTAAVAMSLLA